MKCWSIVEMEESLISGRLDELEKHIENCPECLARYNQLLQEQSEFSDALFPDALPSSFTNKIMEEIQETTIDPVGEPVQMNLPSGESAHRTNRTIQRWTVAVATILILCGSLIFASPSIAEFVRSMFSSDASLDPGLLQSRELGLIQDPGINVSSHGYRIQINEVSADAVRLTIALKITDRFGQPIKDGFDPEKLIVKDEQGNEVGLGSGITGYVGGVYVYKYTYKGELTSSTIIVESLIDKIKETKGNWKFSFPVDLTRAASLTTVDELDERYVTPEGLTIQMNRLTHTPSGVKLELTTSLSQQVRNKVPADMEEKQKLMFHFEDEQGKIISQVNGLGSFDMLVGVTSKRTEKGVHWAYTFIDLPYDTQHIKMVLDGYSIPEKSEGSIVINPSKLSKENAVFNHSGDIVRFKSFKITQDPDQQAAIAAGVIENQEPISAGVFEIKGTYINTGNPDIDQWQAIDDKGNNYPVEFRGRTSLEQKEQDGIFIVKGLNSIPMRLTLIRSIVDRYYSDIQWSFDLPRGKLILGLKNNEIN
ncbi:DUF4179 domain-containing protein [Paenibacillus sp. FSL R7-0337]|uniref:DUF4179 domain-containing protein n=1 Tax=Paenibacillus sp. FSL R7-0337 TaxID=1926588 RepID=UPI0009F8405A|nr:DUF4179 domain-containing protein [Paenibacillus sp. FSL R7-0337]